jgi:hypothetical protein
MYNRLRMLLEDVMAQVPDVVPLLSAETIDAIKAVPVSRDDLERKLARAILAVDRKYLSILENSNGVLPPNYWYDYENELRQSIASPLRAQIEQSFGSYSDYVNFIDKSGAVEDIDTAMTQAINEVARGITENTRLNFEASLRQGLSFEEIIEKIALRFSSGHAEQVSITELTRAEAFFSDALSSRLHEQGANNQIRWLTSEDEKVCPLCSPADHKLKDEPINTPKGSWNGQTWGNRYGRPPAHPNCRCKTVVELVNRMPQ